MNARQFMSEEDIRSKVVACWLAEHGFSEQDLSFEFSFVVRIGRSSFRIVGDKLQPANEGFVCPRTDVLVRNANGLPLLIIEAKAIDEQLDDNARDQAISYARLLDRIAPFAIITNGRHSRIFDSLTRDELSGERIPLDHVHAKNQFIVHAGDIELRAEALNTLVSFSKDNLNAFCSAQVADRMQRLRGEHIESGKKYCPSLFVERTTPKDDLQRLIRDSERRVILIIGPPQSGKTNLVCDFVERQISNGSPCLFYSAIGMRGSLYDEMTDDFEWVFKSSTPKHLIIHRTLSSILERSKTGLTIVIDGLNEIDGSLVKAIDRESQRTSDNIRFVISLTDLSVAKVLQDHTGNCSFIAEAAGLNRSALDLIALRDTPERIPDHWSVVRIGELNKHEQEAAYAKYSENFNVSIPLGHKRISQPFLLSLAMRMYQGRTLPIEPDEIELLSSYLDRRLADRSGIISQRESTTLLCNIAKKMLEHGAPLKVTTLGGLANDVIIPDALFEGAILTEIRSDNSLPNLDFYFGRDRDFVICIWLSDLSSLMKSSAFSQKLEYLTKTACGYEALAWFFRQKNHLNVLLEEDSGFVPRGVVKRLFIEGLYYAVRTGWSCQKDEIHKYVISVLKDEPDPILKVQAFKLAILLAKNPGEIQNLLPDGEGMFQIIQDLLSMAEDTIVIDVDVWNVVFELARDQHWDNTCDPDETSDVTDALIRLIIGPHGSKIQAKAAECFAFAAPRLFLLWTRDVVRSGLLYGPSLFGASSSLYDLLKHAVEIAGNQLLDDYYGSMCPGIMNAIVDDPELVEHELERFSEMAGCVLELFHGKSVVSDLIAIRLDLEKMHADI